MDFLYDLVFYLYESDYVIVKLFESCEITAVPAGDSTNPTGLTLSEALTIQILQDWHYPRYFYRKSCGNISKKLMFQEANP